MNTFLRLNKKKIQFAFVFSIIVMTILICIILGLAYFYDQLPETNLFVGILIIGCIGFPLFMILFIVVLSMFRMKANAKIFEKIDNLRADNISVENILIFEDTKWFFTDYGKQIIHEGYKIKAYIHSMNPKEVIFEYKFRAPKSIKNANINVLKDHDIEIDLYRTSARKRFSKREIYQIDIRQLRTHLTTLINKIKHLENLS